MIPCYCTNMIGNKRNPFIAPKCFVVLHFYDNILHILLVNVNYFTFYHSNGDSVGIPVPENIEIDTSFIFLCQLLMKIKPFLNVHTSIGGHLGFCHFMDTRRNIERGTISKIV